MTDQAIIFGSIGTIVETSAIQRDAFNQAFEEAGIDWHWSEEIYIPMLQNSGGERRIRDYAEAMGTTVNPTELHQRKTEIFDKMMIEQPLSLRPGVLTLISYAKDNGIKAGFASTTSRNNINAIFEALDGALHRSTFDFVGDADAVAASKPDPEIYYRAMTAMAVTPSHCIAIEDTEIAMKAALAADIDCIAFPGAYVKDAEFKGAFRVTDVLSVDVLPAFMRPQS